ncbi:uncharacterized protein LOC117342802 [Pecten maximus]|uniref:uncharacterized protein LOC117342802 n=1 Tax=Pecten maximus TaxID=6579 RepID=UPI0014590E45|nr:uncharacterized protein LOC117342802 [Pecten maximus]
MTLKTGMYSQTKRPVVTVLTSRNVVLLCTAAIVLFLLMMASAGPCGWRRFHKLWPTQNVPIFITGADSKTYQDSKKFLMDLYKFQESRYWGLQVVYVDLGLTLDQLQDLNEFCLPCECVLRQIPSLLHIIESTDVERGFTEAMIINVLLEEYPFFMWIDSSTRLNSSRHFTELFQKTIKNGLQIAVGNDHVDDKFGLAPNHFQLLGENPIYYSSSPSLDTSWMLVGELDPKLDGVLSKYFTCVERSLCYRQNMGDICQSSQVIFSVKQCQDMLTVSLIKEFDHCYRSFSFSMERYVVMENSRCVQSSAAGY